MPSSPSAGNRLDDQMGSESPGSYARKAFLRLFWRVGWEAWAARDVCVGALGEALQACATRYHQTLREQFLETRAGIAPVVGRRTVLSLSRQVQAELGVMQHGNLSVSTHRLDTDPSAD